MKAITVEPHARDRSPRRHRRAGRPQRVGPRGGHRGGCVRDRRRNRRGKVRLGSSGQDTPRARTRVAGRGDRPGPELLAQGGRSRGRHCPATGPRAVFQLRGGRVGHVPQRPVHRARHQARWHPRGRVGTSVASVSASSHPLASCGMFRDSVGTGRWRSGAPPQ